MEQSTETARSLRDQYAEALITRIKASIIIDPAKQPGTVGQPLAATEHDLADAVLAVRDEELERLRADLKRVTDRACRDSEDLAKAQAERDALKAAWDRMDELIESYPPGSNFAQSGAQALFRRIRALRAPRG